MAAMSNEEVLSEELRAALIERFYGWELCDFLNVSIEEVIDVFEHEIVDNMDELEELVGLRRNNNDDE